MDIKRLLYAFPPRITAAIIALAISVCVTLAANRIYDGVKIKTESQDQIAENDGEGSEPSAKDENENNQNAALDYADAPGVGLAVASKSALILSVDDSTVLACKNIFNKTSMGQISVFMTAMLVSKAINDGNIGLNDEAVCPALAAQSPSYSLSSSILPIGKRMYIKDILKCMFYQNGSSYSYTLAVHVSGGADEFVEQMNLYAVELGLKNTHFDNCAGDIGENSYTTAYDIALLVKHMLKDELLKEIICSNEVLDLSMGYSNSVMLAVKNDFFSTYATDHQAKNDGLLGGKVCSIGYAQNAVVIFSCEGKDYVCVMLDSLSAFSDALILYSAYVLS